MRSGYKAATWLLAGLVVVSVAALPGCGGSSGGGDGGTPNLGEFLALSETVFFGTREMGMTTLMPYPTAPANGVPVPPGGATTVGPATFPAGSAGRQDFLQLSFNNLIQADTIFSTTPSAADGIVVFRQVETPPMSGNFQSIAQPFSLDANGAIEASNAFPAANTAPPTLRLYYDMDDNITTPESIPPGNYVLVITETLRAFNGGPFCVANFGPNCVNSYLPVLPFAVGTDDLVLSVNQSNPSVPLQNDPAVPLDSEIVINFSDAVDFGELVGTMNLSTRDPFITQPRGLQFVADCNMGAPIPEFNPMIIGNLYLAYNPPVDPMTMAAEPLPPNLGYIVYMPDPVLNPTQVRIRFVDTTNLVGVDNPAQSMFQNYASNPTRFPITSNDPSQPGTILSLPPRQSVPGSLPGYNPALGATDQRAAILDVVVMSSMFMPTTPPFPAPPMGMMSCYMQSNNGAVDRTGNTLRTSSAANDFWLRFIWAEGAALARNPQPPDATFVGAQQANLKGLAVINTANTTTTLAGPGTQAPITYGTFVTGLISLTPNRLMNPGILGTPKDIEVGHWILTQMSPAQVSNNITNPGRGPTAVPGVPDSQNGITPRGLLDVIGLVPPVFPPIQPYGNFLYVVDGDAGSVKVFNGYNFQQITSLTGIPSPEGLGISPNLEFLYVSNFNEGTVQRIFSNPTSPNFHTVAGTVVVGNGPQAISVQPSNEDVFVANFAGNSFSIIDAATQQVRSNFSDPAAVGPSDIFITNRMLGMGLTNAYTAFIVNFFSDNVTVYESDSPAVPENTVQGVIKANIGGFNGPRRGTWNWQTFIGLATEPGCFVANTLGTTVDELTLLNFTLSPPPNFPGPPGIREYHILKSYDSAAAVGSNVSPSDASIDNHSGLYNAAAVGITINKAAADASAGAGVPSVTLVSYPGAGVVVAFSYGTGGTVYSMASVPGCDFLQSYYDQ